MTGTPVVPAGTTAHILFEDFGSSTESRRNLASCLCPFPSAATKEFPKSGGLETTGLYSLATLEARGLAPRCWLFPGAGESSTARLPASGASAVLGVTVGPGTSRLPNAVVDGHVGVMTLELKCVARGPPRPGELNRGARAGWGVTREVLSLTPHALRIIPGDSTFTRLCGFHSCLHKCPLQSRCPFGFSFLTSEMRRLHPPTSGSLLPGGARALGAEMRVTRRSLWSKRHVSRLI